LTQLHLKEDNKDTMSPSLMHRIIPAQGDAPALRLTPPTARDHVPPRNLSDRFAAFAKYPLRTISDLCFSQPNMHRAVMLETAAAVPGMVGAALPHLRSLRLLRGRLDRVKLLLDKAENESNATGVFPAGARPLPRTSVLPRAVSSLHLI
jgi:Alternative oxidase